MDFTAKNFPSFALIRTRFIVNFEFTGKSANDSKPNKLVQLKVVGSLT